MACPMEQIAFEAIEVVHYLYSRKRSVDEADRTCARWMRRLPRKEIGAMSLSILRELIDERTI